MSKKCKKCAIVKNYNEFDIVIKFKDGYGFICKSCKSNSQIKDKTKINYLVTKIYNSQCYSSKARNDSPPEYTKQELKEWLINQPNFKTLHINWIKSNFNKWITPSVDRTDDYNGYSLDRIQLMTWEENKRKGESDMRNGINNKQSKAVIGTCVKTGIETEYFSMSEAGRKTIADFRLISHCCLGKRKTNGGYRWRFA